VAVSAEERDLLAMHLITGIGPRLTAALLERFGTPSAVRSASRDELMEVPYLGSKVAGQLQTAWQNPDIDAECALLEQFGVELRRLGAPGYPAALATVPAPPQLLYVKGTLEPRDEQAVAIVGSRACSSYGRRIAERLGHDLARAGWTIVSGLARGIDGCAHRGALQAGGRTVAVLAGGLSRIYPPEHKDLAAEVAAAGALVTESPMKMEPMATLFPARNRIISGLSRAVVIVEAAERSGALITARLAAEQGREVFAVPGAVDSPASAGSLHLLRQGAKLVRSADDILEDLQALPILDPVSGGARDSAVPPGPPPNLDETQQRIWDALDERRTVDELSRQMQIATGDLARHLMTLELKKLIRRLPGNWYERA
jgi:DNA processing protein